MNRHIVLTFLLIAACSSAFPQQQGCPFPQTLSVTCENDAPKCKQTRIIRNCGPVLNSSLCCNPSQSYINCCIDRVDLAGTEGPCPAEGQRSCKFGLFVANPDTGSVLRACSASPYPNAKPPAD